MKVDLWTQTDRRNNIRRFVEEVTEKAIQDHLNNVKGKTGAELTRMFTTDRAKGHDKMATAIYNKVRWALELEGGK